jgi:predicted dehydrogenase
LCGIYEEDEKAGRMFAKKYSTKYFKRFDDLLKSDIDAIVITAATSKHYSLANQAAEAGKNILCEKPIALTLNQARLMAAKARKHKIVFQMCYVLRYHTASALVKQLLDQGRIGKVRALIGTNKLNALTPLGAKWMTVRTLSGGGAVMDHTVHLADLFRWYTHSEVSQVYTEIGSNLNKTINVEDNFLTTAVMENGIIGHIDGSWSYSAGFPSWGDLTIQVTGTAGTVELDAFRQNVSYSGMNAPNNKLRYEYYGCDANKEMIRSFLACIINNEAPLASANDGVKGLEVTLASYESAKRHEVVRINKPN